MLCGCGPSYSPDTYASSAVQQANKVAPGIVIGVRQVGVTAAGTTGAVVGGAAGGIAGAQTPGGGVTQAFGALGGTLVGGLVGTTVEHATGDTQAFEYIVRETNGDLVSVTQKDIKPLSVGQKVLVIAGNQARVVPDYTVPLQVEPTTPATSEKQVALPSTLPDLPQPGLVPTAPTATAPTATAPTAAAPVPPPTAPLP